MSELFRKVAGQHGYNDPTQTCRCGVPTFLGPGSKIREIGPHAHARHVAEATEVAVREQIITALEAAPIVCPVHSMPDCSPLLNGCALPEHLRRQRSADVAIARGEA